MRHLAFGRPATFCEALPMKIASSWPRVVMQRGAHALALDDGVGSDGAAVDDKPALLQKLLWLDRHAARRSSYRFHHAPIGIAASGRRFGDA